MKKSTTSNSSFDKSNSLEYKTNNKVEKPPVVQIVRFARFWNQDQVVDNLSGVTFVFDIDYENDQIRAGWSVCDGDNFNKKVGIHFAKERLISDPIIVELVDKTIPDCGTMEYVIEKISENDLLIGHKSAKQLTKKIRGMVK